MKIIFKKDLERITLKVWGNRQPFKVKRKKTGKGLNKTTEMSDYFDYAQYDKATRAHAFYKEMIVGMIKILKREQKKTKERLRVLEIGSGNGSLTDELVRLRNLEIISTDVDKNAIKFVQNRLKAKNLKVVRANALTFRTKNPFDVIIASWNYEHITNYKNGHTLAQSIVANLKDDGMYIEGAELVAPFKNEEQRQRTFIDYHEDIIDRALKNKNQDTAEIEWGAMVSGITKVSHHKRDKNTHVKEMARGGLKLVEWKKYGPFTKKVDGAGNYLFVFKKK